MSGRPVRRPAGCPVRRAARAATFAAVAATTFGGCASPGTPPGGPLRREPPRLVRVSPESGAVNVRPREVVFAYDAVVSETPRGGAASASAGTSGLEGIVTVSPRSGSISVDWRRDRIAVRPRRGFLPNVTYTVTVLPGLQDLRSNVRDSANAVVFSTGGAIARAALRGVVFDWVNDRPAARAVVEATGGDSVTYFAVADSVGRFVLPNVPAGAYLVRATVDVNLNRSADPREAFDTARATATVAGGARPPGDDGPAFYAFVRDSVRPALTTVTATDTSTLRLTFDRPLRPDQTFAGRVVVLGADSAAVPIRSVSTAAAADSAGAAERTAARIGAPGAQPADAPLGPAAPTAGAPRPGTTGGAGAPPPRPARPIPPTELVVRLAAPLRPNAPYRVRVTDVRSLSNVAGTTDRAFTSPRAEPPARPEPPAGARPSPAPVRRP